MGMYRPVRFPSNLYKGKKNYFNLMKQMNVIFRWKTNSDIKISKWEYCWYLSFICNRSRQQCKILTKQVDTENVDIKIGMKTNYSDKNIKN